MAWLTLVVGLLGVGFYWWRLQNSHEQLRSETLAQVGLKAMQLADAQAAQVESLLLGMDLALRHYRDANQAGDVAGTRRAVQIAMASFPNGAVDHFVIVGADGYLIGSSPHTGERVFVGDREYFRAHLQKQTDSLVIGPALKAKVSGQWVVPLTRPIVRNEQFVGVAVMALSAQYLGDVLTRLPLSTGDSSSIVYRDGSYIARSQGMPEIMGKSMPADRLFLQPRAPDRGNFRMTAFADRLPRLYGWSRLREYPMILNVGFDEASVMAPVEQEISRARWRNLGGTTLVLSMCLALLGLLWAASRQQRALSKSRTLLRSTLDSTDDGILVVRDDGRVLDTNPRFMALWHMPQDVIDTRDDKLVLAAVLDQLAEPQEFLELVNQLYGKDDERSDILRFKDGRYLERYTRAFRLDGRRVRLWSFRDITTQKQAQVQHQLAASVFANSYEGIMITDAHSVIVDVNPAFTRITGYSKEEVIGQTPRLLASGRHAEGHYEGMWESLRGQDYWRGEMTNRRKNGEIYVEMLSISVVRDSKGQLNNYIGVFSDISVLKDHAAQLDRIAYFDPLTGVPNRRLLADRLNQAIVRGHRSGRQLAVCYMDLDGFKPINDRYGHAQGDQLLIEVTRRLQGMLRAEDTLARLGGDEFVLLLSDLGRAQECFDVLDRVLSVVSAPAVLDGVSVAVSASIGVTLFPPDDGEADSLLRHADQAMYRAKEAGKNRYFLFDPDQDKQLKAHRYQLQRLQEALDKREFVLHYQPKVDMVTGRIFGAEALIRWQHPEKGLLPPASFLHYMDSTELEVAVGEWVIESVLEQSEAWRKAGLDIVVSANVGANQLLQPNFPQRLKWMLERHPQTAPDRLELEILESVALHDLALAVSTLSQCHAMGVRFALDDFGTGYSSLAYFRRLPIDMLKIDQSFVRAMLDDANDLGIVESVVRLAQAFKRPVIAEGVETLAHGAVLVQIGCRYCQGYGIARPMPAQAMPAWAYKWLNDAIWTTLSSHLPPEGTLPVQMD